MRSMTVAFLVGAAFLLLGAPMGLAKPAAHLFSGEVSHLDKAAKTLAVKERAGKPWKEMTFTLAPNAKITQGAQAKSLGELKVGERVRVTYDEQGDAHQAQKVEVLAAKTAQAKPAYKPTPKTKSTY